MGRGIENYEKNCKLCKTEEDLKHFLTKYPKLTCHRDKEILEKYRNQDTKKQTEDIPFNNKEYRREGKVIRKMWLFTKELLKPP